MYFKNKSGIIKIITISLLILSSVFVTSYVYNWFSYYQSNIYNSFDLTSGNKVNLKYINSNYLLVENGNKNNFSFKKIKIGGVDCNISGVLEPGTSKVYLANCTTGMNSGVEEVAMFSENTIVSQNLILRKQYFNDFSTIFKTGICDVGYTRIYGLESFNNSHVEVSSASNYTYNLCLKHNVFNLGNSCNGNYVRLFYLDDFSNSHAYTNNTSPYGTNWQEVCVSSSQGDISTSISTTDPNDGSLCIGSIDTIDNVVGSHMGDCSGFSNKIWLKIR